MYIDVSQVLQSWGATSELAHFLTLKAALFVRFTHSCTLNGDCCTSFAGLKSKFMPKKIQKKNIFLVENFFQKIGESKSSGFAVLLGGYKGVLGGILWYMWRPTPTYFTDLLKYVYIAVPISVPVKVELKKIVFWHFSEYLNIATKLVFIHYIVLNIEFRDLIALVTAICDR